MICLARVTLDTRSTQHGNIVNAEMALTRCSGSTDPPQLLRKEISSQKERLEISY